MSVAAAPVFPEATYAGLIQRFHLPFFLEKLARDWGVVPQSEAEVQQLLEAAAMLRQQKEAAAAEGSGNTFLTEACDSLKTAVAGLGGQTAPTSYDHQVKQAAATLLQDPQAQAEVESWGAYLGALADLHSAA